MKFLWVGWAGGGAVPPQLALCELLVERGHEVVAVGDARLGPDVERAGVRFEELDEPPRPVNPSPADIERWVHAEKCVGPRYAAAMRDGIERLEPDRVLVDGMLFSAQVEARAAGVPYAALWHMLMNQADAWRGGSDPQNKAENLASHNAHRVERGLEPVEAVQDTLLDATWVMALSYGQLNQTGGRVWPNLRFVGAPMPAVADAEIRLPPGDAPLVLVGFSTTPMGQAAVLQRVVDGLAELDVRVLVTLGPLGEDELTLPANAVAAPYVPHDQVLPSAALTVSHVGHGTMCAAARHGVPVLAMPLGRDQHTNAEVLSELGMGATLPQAAPPEEIAKAANQLLSDEEVHRACQDTAAQIADHDDLDTAIDLLIAPT